MTRDSEELAIARRLVVVFDICSSTSILEDLKRTDNLAAWRNLLIRLKEALLREGQSLRIELYKFIGDGWVLLFPDDVDREGLCRFLNVISMAFDEEFENSIAPLLSFVPSPIGLMFGVDAGDLVRLEMNEQVEYLGRAINVASRLQAETKNQQGGPSYKALFSKNSLNSRKPPKSAARFTVSEVELRNISPPKIQCNVFQAHQGVRPDHLTTLPKRTTAKRTGAARKKKLRGRGSGGKLGEVGFANSGGLVARGWVSRDLNMPGPQVSRLRKVPIANSVEIEGGWEPGLDYVVEPHLSPCKRLKYAARFRGYAALYTHVSVVGRGGLRQNVWLQHVLGRGDEPVEGSEPKERKIFVSGIPLGNAWLKFDLYLPGEVKRAYEREGFEYSSLLRIRLRGSLAISPIELYKE